MTFNEFFDLITDQLVPKLESHRGLAVFARKRSKFEGWLKVELVSLLSEHFQDVAPEKDRFDLTFDDWAVELKTTNTNYRFPNVENRSRPFTLNVQGVLLDILKLRQSSVKNKAVLFISFPARHENPNWQKKLRNIEEQLTVLRYHEFSFFGGIPAVVYCGKV